MRLVNTLRKESCVLFMKTKMKSKSKSAALIIIACTFAAVFLIAYCGDVLEKNSDKQDDIIKIEQKCDIQIDYPSLNNKKLESGVDSFIKQQENEFLESVRLLPEPTDGKKYSFSVKNETQTRFDVETVHLTVKSYTGQNNYSRTDASYHGTADSDKLVSLGDFLENEQSLNKLSELSNKYLSQTASEQKLKLDDACIKNATSPKQENFSNFFFGENGFEILFTPAQLADASSDSLRVTIPYYELGGVLKKDMLKKAGVTDSNQPTKRDLSQFKGKKLIAFTFDDGPSKNTGKLLDALDKYNARVTFFVVGNRVASYSDTLKRAYMMGNQIGTHSYSHASLVKLSDAEVKSEISKANAAVKKVTGADPDIIRPPYGNTDERVKKLCGVPSIMWNVDTLDWKTRNKDKVYNAIIKSAHDGAVVLMHDLYETSVDGAIAAMDKLSKEGYAFVTINEMAQLRGITLDKATSYSSFKPAASN